MLIGVTGQKGSGKDTFAGELTARNFANIKMADTLKEMLRTMYRMAGVDESTIERKIEGDLKEEPCEILGGATPRWAMQSLGTDWAKMVDPSHQIWARIWRGRVQPMLKEGTPVVCTDIRFQHEAATVRQLGGHLVRVVRPGTENRDPHPSEREMEGIEVDETVYNVASIEELQDKAGRYLEEVSS